MYILYFIFHILNLKNIYIFHILYFKSKKNFIFYISHFKLKKKKFKCSILLTNHMFTNSFFFEFTLLTLIFSCFSSNFLLIFLTFSFILSYLSFSFKIVIILHDLFPCQSLLEILKFQCY